MIRYIPDGASQNCSVPGYPQDGWFFIFETSTLIAYTSVDGESTMQSRVVTLAESTEEPNEAFPTAPANKALLPADSNEWRFTLPDLCTLCARDERG
jgi:hypothetical protein